MNAALLTASAGASAGGIGIWIVIYIVIFGGMWFIAIRPQKKKEKEIAAMQNNIKVGQTVLLQSGIYGKVVDEVNDLLILELGLNKSVRIPVKKIAVAAVGEPNLTVGKKAGDRVVEDGKEYEYVEVEVEVDENGNEIKK